MEIENTAKKGDHDSNQSFHLLQLHLCNQKIK